MRGSWAPAAVPRGLCMRHLILELRRGAAALAVFTSPVCTSVSAPVLPTLPLVTLLAPALSSDLLNTGRAAQKSVLDEAKSCPWSCLGCV